MSAKPIMQKAVFRRDGAFVTLNDAFVLEQELKRVRAETFHQCAELAYHATSGHDAAQRIIHASNAGRSTLVPPSIVEDEFSLGIAVAIKKRKA